MCIAIRVTEFQNTSTISTSTFATTIVASSTTVATSQPVTESADHSTSLTFTSTSSRTPITTVTTSYVNLISSTSTTASTTTNAILNINSPTLSSSQYDNNNSSSVGVIVTIVVLVVVFIIITVVVIGIIVVWKRKTQNEQHTKPEGVYYSTIDETALPRSPTNKPESDYIEMNGGQENKDSQYMDIPHSTKQANKVTMQDNPAYSIASDKDNSVISTSSVMVTFTIFNEVK